MKFTVPDMTCQHCVKTITQAILAKDAQAQVACDVPTHTVNVQTLQEDVVIKQAIIDAGYEIS